MKPLRTYTLASLLLASTVFVGCRQDREMVFTAPRSKPIRVDSSNVGRTPIVNVETPDTKPLPASNGIDVPMVEQN